MFAKDKVPFSLPTWGARASLIFCFLKRMYVLGRVRIYPLVPNAFWKILEDLGLV